MRKESFLVLMALMGAAAVYLQIYPPTNDVDRRMSFLLIVAFFAYLGIIYFIVWIMNETDSYVRKVDENTKHINRLADELESEKRFHDMVKRVTILESRRGEIDIRWILLVMSIIVFILYLRAMGVF